MIYKILVFACCYKIIHLETKQSIFLRVLQYKRMFTSNDVLTWHLRAFSRKTR